MKKWNIRIEKPYKYILQSGFRYFNNKLVFSIGIYLIFFSIHLLKHKISNKDDEAYNYIKQNMRELL